MVSRSDEACSLPFEAVGSDLAPEQWAMVQRWVLKVVRGCTALSPSVFVQLQDDLTQEACLVFLRAAEEFDASLGVPFAAYARQQIRFGVREYLRSEDPLPRSVRRQARRVTQAREELCQEKNCEPSINEIAARAELSRSRVSFILTYEAPPRVAPHLESLPQPTEQSDEPALLVETAEQRLALRNALYALPEKQRYVLTWRYMHGFTVQQIAERLAVTPSAVSQLCTRGLTTVRQYLTEWEWVDIVVVENSKW